MNYTIKTTETLVLWGVLAMGFLVADAVADAAEVALHVERNVPAPMRDGVILRADVYRPEGTGPHPVLLMRTPYSKADRDWQPQAKQFTQAGYIVVLQDIRGRYESNGTFESSRRFVTHEAEDGYDSVEWAARLPGSNGKVGTFGYSYNASLQWKLAPLRPPSLLAMAAHSIPARYTDLEGPGTIRPGRRLSWWYVLISPDMRRRANRPGPHTEAEARKLWKNGEREKWINFLPWMDLPYEMFEDETDIMHYWLKKPHKDPWKLHEGCKDIVVPNLDVVGWYDHCNGNMLLHRTMVAEAKTPIARTGTKIVIGPWNHRSRGSRRTSKSDFGPEAKMDLPAMEVRWFDYWLKDKSNGVDQDSPVKIFIMGDNRWRDEPHWPLERAQEKTLYLSSSGHANTPAGDGQLIDTTAAPTGKDRYQYDPENPVPSLWNGGSNTIPADQSPNANREDILVYQSEPLTERLEVTGNPIVKLHASSSAPDTDFFVRLIDVSPDGTSRNVSMGMVRARYRNGLDKPKELITPGEIVTYTIRMNPTSNAFLPGHRLRLDVTSSDFPNYDRNHNTAADQNADAKLVTANQTIHHGGQYASQLILPVIADESH